MKNIKLLIEYNGTRYHGWQSQINAIAIQDVITEAIRKLTGEEINLIGSSRTDVGVHAFGQVANFHTESTIPSKKFSYALNSLLPSDIVIKSSEEVSEDFHSRFCAKGKSYNYQIYNSPFPPALLKNRAWHVILPLNLGLMQKAAGSLIGEHDFSAFRASGSSVKSSVRTIISVNISSIEELITIRVEGNGFLYNMVRIIAGTLVAVGSGKIETSDMEVILCNKDRKKAGATAPPHGLYLVHINY